MELKGITAIVAGDGPGASRLSERLRRAGARLLEEGPAELFFHVGRASEPSEPEAIVRLLERAGRGAQALRHICLVRETPPAEPSRPEEVHPQVVEDGLRYLAALHGVPLAVLRGASDDERLAAEALRAAAERLQGELELGGGAR